MDHIFSRLSSIRFDPETKGANRKIWFMQVQKMYRTEFIILINGEEVSLVFFGEVHGFPQKEKSIWT